MRDIYALVDLLDRTSQNRVLLSVTSHREQFANTTSYQLMSHDRGAQFDKFGCIDVTAGGGL